eukprot:834904-Rhodomonas_salina.1
MDGVRGLEKIPVPPPDETPSGHRRIEVASFASEKSWTNNGPCGVRSRYDPRGIYLRWIRLAPVTSAMSYLPDTRCPVLIWRMVVPVDSFVALRFEGQDHKTDKKQKTYSPDWNQTFTFLVDDVAKPLGDMRLEVLDWDRNSKNDLIGHVIVPGTPLSLVLRACYALSGTDMPFFLLLGDTMTRVARSQPLPTFLCACYAMPGADLAYSKPGTEVPDGTMQSPVLT